MMLTRTFVATALLVAASAAKAETPYERAAAAFAGAESLTLRTVPQSSLVPMRCIASTAPLDLINGALHGLTVFVDPVIGSLGRISFNLAEYPEVNLVSLDLHGQEVEAELTDLRGQIKVRRVKEIPRSESPAYIFSYTPEGTSGTFICWTF